MRAMHAVHGGRVVLQGSSRFANIVFFDQATEVPGDVRRAAGHVHSVPHQRIHPPPRALPDVDFPRFVLGRAGLAPDSYRAMPLARRVTACLRALRAPSIEAAREALERRPELVAVALDALLIGVTGFCRDARVFQDLSTILPGPGPGRTGLDVWSAACSDGAELYSMAMILAERDLLDGSRLLGTDFRPTAVGQAWKGAFPERALAGLPADLRARYIVPRAGGGQVAERLRNRATWRTGDVQATTDRRAWDVVLCRNLSIYLEPSAAADLWDRLATALRPGGLLVVGKAERPTTGLPLARIANCLYRRERKADERA